MKWEEYGKDTVLVHQERQTASGKTQTGTF